MADQDKDYSDVQFGSNNVATQQKSQREEMLDIVRSGRSTMHKGRLIKTVSQVPSEADLAAGNPAQAAEAAARLQQQIEDAKAQLEQIANAKPVEPKPEFKPIERPTRVNAEAATETKAETRAKK
jgi:hypothetical protein